MKILKFLFKEMYLQISTALVIFVDLKVSNIISQPMFLTKKVCYSYGYPIT